jgi:hypothetical protein
MSYLAPRGGVTEDTRAKAEVNTIFATQLEVLATILSFRL